jgi:hypothetical protein
MNTACIGPPRCRQDQHQSRRLDLTAEGVAADGDVQRAESLLIFSAVQHVLGEQDHPGAGAVRRQSASQCRDQGLAQPEDPRQLVDGGGLSAGQHDPIQSASSAGRRTGRASAPHAVSARRCSRHHLAERGRRRQVDGSPAALGEAMGLGDVIHVDSHHGSPSPSETFAMTSGSS